MRSVLVVLAVASLASSARADGARDLGRPYRAGAEDPRPSAPEPARPPPRGADADPEAGPDADASVREYGDGRAAEVSWNDPDLDLEPRGRLHAAFSLGATWIGPTARFVDAGGGSLAAALDLCLEPSIAIHLRIGALIAVRAETRATLREGELRSAPLVIRGLALVGVHAFRWLAVRAGVEVGQGWSFAIGAGGIGGGETLGFAAVGQIGIRLFTGRMEIGGEIAAELREGSVLSAARPPVAIQELAPRLALYFAVTS
jgi:hypothetical protein